MSGGIFLKKVLILYFSLTGNTKTACEYIKKHLTQVETELLDIRQISYIDWQQYDLLGFATYTDYFDAPLRVQKFLKELPDLSGKVAFILNTCAGMSGHSLATLYKLLNQRNCNVVKGYTLHAPESFPPLLVRGRTKAELPSLKNLKGFQNFILSLHNFLNGLPDHSKLYRPNFMDKVIPGIHRRVPSLWMGKKMVDSSLCNQCGICVKVCPYQAITMKQLPEFQQKQCAGCWACYNNCPQNAIYTKSIRRRGQYQPLAGYLKKLQ